MPINHQTSNEAKRRYHDSKNRTYVSLSFSVPSELQDPMDRGAAARGMNRSQYIVWLVERDLYMQNVNPESYKGPRKYPPRVGRKKYSPAD